MAYFLSLLPLVALIPRLYYFPVTFCMSERENDFFGILASINVSRVQFLAGAGNFFLHHSIQNGSGTTQPPIQWVQGALSLGIERPGREANHSPTSSAEVKECVELYLHSRIRLHGVVLS
jgi:hypothetical protein